MSIIYESGPRSSFLADENYPNIDQASEEVERYDEADGSNDVSDVMHDVGNLGVAVTSSYHPPEQSILAESEPSRVLDVVDNAVDNIETHGLPSPSDTDMNSAAAAAVASIAAAEAEVARAAAAQAVRHSLPAAQALQQPASLTSPSPGSLKDTPSPPSRLAMGMVSQRVRPIPKPERDVQKNDQGVYQCTWSDCTEDITTFNRKCEYNKHMDKHERPYRCTADGCQKLPGFTYSGGLLRHEREVHGKHGGPRNPLHCPHTTCKRHTGKGFSRTENLNEHLRRVHTLGSSGSPEGNDVSAPIMPSMMGHVTSASAADNLVSTTAAAVASSASEADALLAHTNHQSLLALGGLGGLSNVLRSLPVLPSSPSTSGENGVVGSLGHVNGVNGTSGDSSSGNHNHNHNAAAAAAAAVAAAAAAAAANAVAGRYSSPGMLAGVPGADVDSDHAKSMDESLNLLLHGPPPAAESTNSRGRKRTASAMMADAGLGDAALAATYHGQHQDLREEMKRLRQENQEQREQLEMQKQQTNVLILQINALRRHMAQAQVQAQVQAHAQHTQHTQHKLGSSALVLDEPASPTSSSLQDPSDILSG